MRLQDKGNRFVIVVKNTDHLKAQQQKGRSSFIKLNHDPTVTHIKKVKEWADEWKNRGEITKAWHDYIINDKAQLGKNSILYKTHKEGNLIRLLTTGCNKAIENSSRFIEKNCAPLTNNIGARINDIKHLLKLSTI